MSVLLHLSDTHFGTEQAPVVEALVALAARLRPRAVVLSGDITQRALPGQFRAARAFVDRLGAPLLAIPGNHDIALFHLWDRLRQPYARYSAAFGATLEPVHRCDDWLVIGVNTTRPWRHRHGEVSAAQIDRVSELLRTARPGQVRVVVVHQPMAVTEPQDRPHRLRGHAQAQRAWAAAGADLVLGGHIHLPFVREVPTGSRRLWVVQAGTAVSSRTRPGVPHSVNVLRSVAGAAGGRWGEGGPAATGPGCQIEQWDFVPAAGAFECAAVTAVEPSR